MKTGLILATLTLPLLAAPAIAAAQPAGAPAESGSLRVGGNLALVPAGKLTIAAAGDSASEDVDTAFGLGGVIQFTMSENVAFDFAPRLILNLKGETGDSSGEQLDLVGRVLFGAPVSESGARLYGYAAPGYSIIFLPSSADVDNPHGFLLGFGGGAAIPINQQLSFVGELGYHLGFQETSTQGVDVEVSSDLFSLSAGLLVHL